MDNSNNTPYISSSPSPSTLTLPPDDVGPPRSTSPHVGVGVEEAHGWGSLIVEEKSYLTGTDIILPFMFLHIGANRSRYRYITSIAELVLALDWYRHRQDLYFIFSSFSTPSSPQLALPAQTLLLPHLTLPFLCPVCLWRHVTQRRRAAVREKHVLLTTDVIIDRGRQKTERSLEVFFTPVSKNVALFFTSVQKLLL